MEREISQLVDQANAHAAGQRKYADYLERTGQDGYAAFEYRGQTRLTRENFAEETSAAIGRMEAGVRQWGERVSSYCEGHGLTPYDMECYLQERRRLSDAYLAARERLAVLSPAAPEARAGQAPAGRSDLDTVEIGTPPPGGGPHRVLETGHLTGPPAWENGTGRDRTIAARLV